MGTPRNTVAAPFARIRGKPSLVNSTKRTRSQCSTGKVTGKGHVMCDTTPNTARLRGPQMCSIQTSCYSTNKAHSTKELLKPLPKTPDTLVEKVPGCHQTPGIPAEPLALAPLEQQLLQCLQWLDHPFFLPRNVLVQLGTEAFWMSAKDANMLERMDMLTETLSLRQKDEIWTRLEALLMPQHRYPLKQVLRHGVAIVVKRPACVDDGPAGGSTLFRSDDGTTHRVDYDEWMCSLFPAPLRITKHRRVAFEETPPRDNALQTGQSLEKTSPGVPEPLVRPNGLLVDYIDCRQPSCIAASKAYPYEHGLPGDEAESRVAKKPGSVRNALNNLYTNPRAAPQPPSSTSTLKAPPDLTIDVPKQPGSVRAGRLAAEKILGYSVGSLLPPNLVLHKRTAPDGITSAGSIRDAKKKMLKTSKDNNRSFPLRSPSLPQLPVFRRRTSLKEVRPRPSRPGFLQRFLTPSSTHSSPLQTPTILEETYPDNQ